MPPRHPGKLGAGAAPVPGEQTTTRKEVCMFPDVWLPTTPPPWYTIVALGTVIVLILGAWLALAKLLWRTICTVAGLPWVGLTGLCSLVFGRPLTSHGTAAWCTNRQRMKAGIGANGDGLALAQSVDGEPIKEIHGRHCV